MVCNACRTTGRTCCTAERYRSLERGHDLPAAPTMKTVEGAVFLPWTDGVHAVGFRVLLPDGQERYIYFNPSYTDEGADDRSPAIVFVYEGRMGDPCQDAAVHHYDLREAV
jgi:hypothetical protein